MREKTDTFTFLYDVPSGESKSYNKKILANARVKRIKAEFPDGEDGDLHVTIYAERSDKTVFDLLNMVGDRKYLSGNGSKFDQNYDQPVPEYSTIFVDGENVDTQGNAYPVIVEIEIEYE